MISDPDGPVPSRNYGIDHVTSKPLAHRKVDNWNVAETVDTLGRGQPQITFSVLKETFHGVA
jgi:hypothetical protein